jgi:CheY-like chemotaxis protein
MSRSTELLDARILIVDDVVSNTRLLEYALRRGGYLAVSSTNDPTAAAALHAANLYDLVLLDLRMPRTDGFGVMEELRIRGREGAPAVLVLSADPAQRTRALEAGASGFLAKPFVLAEVLEKVREVLETKVPPAAEDREPATALLPPPGIRILP